MIEESLKIIYSQCVLLIVLVGAASNFNIIVMLPFLCIPFIVFILIKAVDYFDKKFSFKHGCD